MRSTNTDPHSYTMNPPSVTPYLLYYRMLLQILHCIILSTCSHSGGIKHPWRHKSDSQWNCFSLMTQVFYYSCVNMTNEAVKCVATVLRMWPGSKHCTPDCYLSSSYLRAKNKQLLCQTMQRHGGERGEKHKTIGWQTRKLPNLSVVEQKRLLTKM